MANRNRPKKKGCKVQIKLKLGPDDPLVQAAFAGVYRSGIRPFFKIDPDTGEHQKINVGKALKDLPIGYDNKVHLIHTFPFPQLEYQSERMKAVAAATERRPKVTVGDNDKGDDLSEDELDEAVSKKNPRYSLIRQGKYWGCYDGNETTVVLFQSRKEAQQHIWERLHHRDTFTAFYGGKVNHNS
jgi:hypothetical protein